MKMRKVFISMALAFMAAAAGQAQAAPGGPGGLLDIQRSVETSSLSGEQKAALTQAAREAVEAGVPHEDVAVIVTGGLSRGADVQTLARFLVVARDVQAQGLPVRPVLNKIEQGTAKGVPPERIIEVVGRVRANLVTAAGMVNEVAAQGLAVSVPEEKKGAVEALAGALERGVPAGDIVELGQKAAEVKFSLAQFGRAVDTLANLKEMGMPRGLALKAARKAVILNYSERGMARMERDLLAMRKSGMSWEDSFKEMGAGLERGRGGMGGGSGSGMGGGFGGGQRMQGK
jgi:uncharacterized membrane protein YgcG